MAVLLLKCRDNADLGRLRARFDEYYTVLADNGVRVSYIEPPVPAIGPYAWIKNLVTHGLAAALSNRRERAMAIRSESRVTIAKSVSEVWAYACDVGRWQEWAPTVRECWVDGGGPLQPGSRLEQRAKGLFGSTRHRAQKVTAVESPRSVAFAGPLGTSAARWGMELESIGDTQTDAMMWVEVDLRNIMRAIPGRVLKGRIQRVMDIEMAAIKSAVESASPG